MDEPSADTAREQDIQAIKERLTEVFAQELETVARMVADKVATDELTGRFEFELRDQVLRLGARALQAGLDEVKKKAIEAPRFCAPIAARS